MDRESEILFFAVSLIGVALAAQGFPEQTLIVLWSILASAILNWVSRDRNSQ